MFPGTRLGLGLGLGLGLAYLQRLLDCVLVVGGRRVVVRLVVRLRAALLALLAALLAALLLLGLGLGLLALPRLGRLLGVRG